MHNFEIINKDLLLFNIENNAFCTGFEEIEPLRIKRKDKGKLEINKKIQKENFPAYNTFYKIVSGSYWTVEDDFDECNEVLDIFGSIEKCKKYNDDIDLVLLPSISYIDIIYKEKLITCTMVQMNDLIVKNNRSKKFWIENEVINSNWDYL
ncbi:hypothetical protein NAPIS_ORF00924 [Vairimorpha apis BRL 01]|uniref:Uncharacterized protein n=1 Tax=Vairimorpha apis BRL 01 TaxID=1037528 RepID=T0L1Y1_9MICR|nr:hypothetical protein NAPIS_ORF00924 [Vairimorpha apis BRL 01]